MKKKNIVLLITEVRTINIPPAKGVLRIQLFKRLLGYK